MFTLPHLFYLFSLCVCVCALAHLVRVIQFADEAHGSFVFAQKMPFVLFSFFHHHFAALDVN